MSALLLSLAALTSSTSTASPVHRYVVTVGFNESANPSQASLRHADDDAARFYELLGPGAKRAYLLTRFDDDSRELFAQLVDRARPPTLASLHAVMAEIRTDLARDDEAGVPSELYFFYAGHGDEEDGEGYVNLADGLMHRPEFRSVLLEGRRADRTHVIIDACKSYFMVSGRGPGGERRPHAVPFAGPEPLDGVGYVLSTSNDAESHEWSALAGGVFSHEVRSGLLGAADADGDGDVEYAELEAFVAVANASIAYPTFRPNVFIRPPPDQMTPLVVLDRLGSSYLVMDSTDAGRVSIRDHRGLRYADLNKAPGRRLRLMMSDALSYYVVWGDRHLAFAPRGGGVRLTELEPTSAIAERNLHKAFTALFEVPFSSDLAAGYQLGTKRLVPDFERPAAAATEVDLVTIAALGSGAGLVVTGFALGAGAIVTRNRIDGAPQQDRPALIDQTDGLTAAAVTTAGVGLVVLSYGLIRYLIDD